VAAKYALCSDVKPGLASAPPALATALGQIAYLTPDNNIVLTDLTGRPRLDITSDAYVSQDGQAGRIYQFPTFSADGQSLAFVSLSTTADFNGITNTVHVAPAVTGTAITDLYATSDWSVPYLDWSPDSKQVAFLTIGPQSGAIRVVSREGGDVSTFDTGTPTYWHWRNDSAAMLTHLGGRAREKGTATISLIEANGPVKANQTVLDQLPGNFQSPNFSPNGQHMLYVTNTGEADELVLADAEGAPICTLAPVEDNAFFAWSPDGAHVAMMDTLGPLTDPAPLTVFDLGDGSNRDVHDLASTFFWSPDGSRLAVFSIVTDTTITSLGSGYARGKHSAPLAQGRSAALRIEVIDPATGNRFKVADTYPSRQFLQYLQYFDQYSRAVTPWSPNGKHVVFSSVSPERGTADIAVGTLNSAQTGMSVSRIAAGTLAFWSPK
jgi:Tol biopolymer transport system component